MSEENQMSNVVYNISDGIDLYSMSISGYKKDELMCFVIDRTIYYSTFDNSTPGGRKIKNKIVKMIKEKDYSEMNKTIVNNGSVTLAKDLISFGFARFVLSHYAFDTANKFINSLLKIDGTSKGKRKINFDERLKRSQFGIWVTIFLFFIALFVPYYVSVAEDMYSVHVILIPFIKLGTKWCKLIFGSITGISFLFTSFNIIDSASMEVDVIYIDNENKF